MKKILFATTALVATAGVAAADVSFGGYARFGVDYNDSRATEEVRITSRFRLVVTASAESDNGLSFGAQIRYQADANEDTYKITSLTPVTNGTGSTVAVGLGKAGFNTPRFWVSTGGLTVSVGHIMGAFENMPGIYAGSVGLTGLGYANVVTNYGVDFYTSGAAGRFGFDVVYSAGAFGVHLTHTFDDAYLAASNSGVSRTGIVASYSMGDYTFALGVQDSDVVTDTDWAFTAGGSFGAFDLTLQVADNGTNDTKYGIAGNYNLSAATSLQGYVNVDTRAAFDVPGGEDMNIGLGFVHNMGGGTSLRGGVASLAGAAGNTVRADLGLLFSF
ncbi:MULTISPECIES: porin [Shimia]|uniref:porin n=1 Tax=Shimia TaxID=573139 RepID=UPI001FB50E90|nr:MULTISPECIES: porin [Shimia]MDV4144832.1 porin [Shimia sp. FJ5]